MSTTFDRFSTAYLPDGTLVNTNLPRFVPGRFGQAIMVEEGTTNMLPLGTSTAVSGVSGINHTITQVAFVTNFGRSDNTSILCTQMQAGDMQAFATPIYQIASPTQSWTGSLWFFTLHANKQFRLQFDFHRSNGTYISSALGVLTSIQQNAWTRISTTITTPAETTGIRLVVLGNHFAVNEQVWFDDLQLEQRNFSTTWQIGGTPRVSEVLSLDTANVNPVEGTIEFWWTPINRPASTIINHNNSPLIVSFGRYHWESMWFLWVIEWGLAVVARGTGSPSWSLYSVVVPGHSWYVLNQPVHFAVTWQSTIFNVYMNGVRHGPSTSTHPITTIAGNIVHFSYSLGAGAEVNAIYDDIRISSRARTSAEILANFNSNQPVPIDAQMNETVWVLPWDNSLASNVTVVRQGQSGIDVVPRSRMTPVMGIVGTNNVEVVPSLARLDHYVPLAAIPIANRVAQFSVPIEPVVDFTIRSEGG